VPDFKDKPFLKQIYTILDFGKQLIEEDKCSEEEAYKMLSKFNAESKGFFDKKSFVNYDKAMRMTGIRQRNKFKEACDKHNIEMNYVNNQPVGFLRTEIEELKDKLREENKKKTEVR
jgi:hypothetical protein